MIENKSIEQIVRIIEKKIMFALMEELPDPSCPRKRDQNNWKKDQVKRSLISKLEPTELGIINKV